MKTSVLLSHAVSHFQPHFAEQSKCQLLKMLSLMSGVKHSTNNILGLLSGIQYQEKIHFAWNGTILRQEEEARS